MISPLSLNLLPALLLLSRAVDVNAVPHGADNLVRREDTSSPTPTPTAWKSILDDGTLSTVTPKVSTDSSGSATTIDARPTSTGAVSTGDGIVASCDSSKYELAKTGNKQPFAPFCQPHNGTDWWVGGNYYVTWNPNHWARNSSVKIVLNYFDAGKGGKIAGTWQSANSYGFINIEPTKDWLINQTALGEGHKDSLDSQIMYFTIADDSPSSTVNIESGPTITIVSKPTPAPADKSPKKRRPVTTLGLAVGLPLVFVFVVGTVLSLHFCMKNKRTVGPISIGGGRKNLPGRGYTGRAVRRQKTVGAVHGGAGGAEYRDEPEEEIAPAGGTPRRTGEWELTSVKGGR